MLISCSNNSSNNNLIKINSIVCFGDSLTYGYGATNGQTYPYFLQQFTNIPVINKGINGNTSQNGLDRIEDILQFKNSIVIVEFGANDFFQQIPISETKKNMEQIVDKIGQNGDIVVIVSAEDKQLNQLHKMLKSLAKEKKVLFINGILNEIWNDRNFFSDEIHPNSKGYKSVADKIYKNIKHLL
ncbi:GDSL-type esterase/lipase family protein [Candidatus Ruminimicrobiellum ovillum]|uniref:GDSL-type esterase/lipase family protein n=1 Tax=Candidatus Ruminimicrobiellum ovillum TaxID=1947927 RepID=UPI00355A2C6B